MVKTTLYQCKKHLGSTCTYIVHKGLKQTINKKSITNVWYINFIKTSLTKAHLKDLCLNTKTRWILVWHTMTHLHIELMQSIKLP